MRLFRKENQECSRMIFYSETFGFELEVMVGAARGGGTPFIRMIGMIVVFFKGCNRRFGIF